MSTKINCFINANKKCLNQIFHSTFHGKSRTELNKKISKPVRKESMKLFNHFFSSIQSRLNNIEKQMKKLKSNSFFIEFSMRDDY